MSLPSVIPIAQRSAKEVIEILGLQPHPEKGHFAEMHRDTHFNSDGKSPGTCIYYLLEGESGLSHWHRVLDGTEIWHWYAGAPMRLSLSWDDGKPVRDHILGNDLWQVSSGWREASEGLRVLFLLSLESSLNDIDHLYACVQGQRPQVVVDVAEWQHAQSLGDWTLVGCTVSPAFTMESFDMADEGWEPRGSIEKDGGLVPGESTQS